VRTFKELLKDFEPFPYKDFGEDILKGKYKKCGKYTYLSPEGKKYDIRNTLNNLSGKE